MSRFIYCYTECHYDECCYADCRGADSASLTGLLSIKGIPGY